MAVIGIDLGATKVAGAIFTARGKILRRKTALLKDRRGRAVGELVRGHVASLLRAAQAMPVKVETVGICVPGLVRPETGRVWAPNIPGWEDYPLREEVISMLGPGDIRVVVDSDRAAGILGEVWRGAARGCRHAVFLAVGTGIGAGILVNGEVLRGAQDIAGAIGWLALERPFRRDYVACGCFEHHASGEGLAKAAKEICARQKDRRGSGRNKPAPTARDLFRAGEGGDAAAGRILRQAVEFWGMASANLVSLLNPEKIIFGGGVFGPAARFLKDIRAEAKKWAQPISMRQVKFEASGLGGDACLYGAGFLALRRSFCL